MMAARLSYPSQNLNCSLIHSLNSPLWLIQGILLLFITLSQIFLLTEFLWLMFLCLLWRKFSEGFWTRWNAYSEGLLTRWNAYCASVLRPCPFKHFRLCLSIFTFPSYIHPVLRCVTTLIPHTTVLKLSFLVSLNLLKISFGRKFLSIYQFSWPSLRLLLRIPEGFFYW